MNKIFFMVMLLVSFKSFSSENNLLQRYQGIKGRCSEISSKIETFKKDFDEQKDALSDYYKDELECSLIAIEVVESDILRQAKMIDELFKQGQTDQELQSMKFSISFCEKKVKKLDTLFRGAQDGFEDFIKKV